jgi:hypothetical protein
MLAFPMLDFSPILLLTLPLTLTLLSVFAPLRLCVNVFVFELRYCQSTLLLIVVSISAMSMPTGQARMHLPQPVQSVFPNLSW